jgi:hypothetical protein
MLSFASNQLVLSMKATPAEMKTALNSLSKKWKVAKKFLSYIGIMDATEMGKKFLQFNITDSKHPLFKSTKSYEIETSTTFSVVASILNRPRALKNWAVDGELYRRSLFQALSRIQPTKIIKEVDKGRYVLRTELIKPFPDEEATEWTMAYTHGGKYIGDVETAKFLFENIGLAFVEVSKDDSFTCCIGFQKDENKWYGWSHRAIIGFGIGDKIFEEDFGNDSTPYVKHGRKTIKNIDEAKLAAIRFAESVS